MDSWGTKIKKLRMSAGLTQEQLAERLGIGIKSIQRYETGKSRPATHELILLATFFDVSTDYLLGLSGLKAQKAEEKNKIYNDGQYNVLYKRFLDCKDYTLIDENATYYWVYYDEDGNYGGQSEWSGWADETKMIEIRRLRPVIPQNAIALCTAVSERPMLINDKEDVAIFLIFGGQAIIKAELCEKYLPEWYEDYIGPTPGYNIRI